MQIAKTGNTLPATVEELKDFIIIRKELLRAHQAKIRAISKINTAYAAQKAALKDAQDIADILLEAEIKLGELIKKIPSQSSQQGRLPKLPAGVTHKLSHESQTLASNPAVVDQVKKEIRGKGDIPTPQSVYRGVKSKEKTDKQNEAEAILLIKSKTTLTLFVTFGIAASVKCSPRE